MNQPTNTPEKFSHYRTSINRWGQESKIPVIDVRDGIVERMIADQMVKANKRSIYITYTEYQRSYKPKTNI